MRRRTQQEEYELLAELDRQERCMVLYGPYDPRADEVMEGWRSAEYGPAQYTDEQRDQEAAFWRSKVCPLGTGAENKYGEYTPEEIKSGERFNAACAQLADAIEAGKSRPPESHAQEVERLLEQRPGWSDALKQEWRDCVARGDTRQLIRNRHLIQGCPEMSGPTEAA